MRYSMLAVAVVLWVSAGAWGAVQSRVVPVFYGEGEKGVVGECVVYWDDAVKVARPGVLVFHEWWGLNEFAKERARQLAELGYVAVAVDLYGEGKTTTDAGKAKEWSSALKGDRAELRARAGAALGVLKRLREVDPKRTAAIGFCFGGTAALELARSGADVRGVVSFHGDVAPPAAVGVPSGAASDGASVPGTTGSGVPVRPATRPATRPVGEIRAKLLVLHGAVDPLVPPGAVRAFQEEMDAANVDYTLVAYAGAVHSFTNPAAGADPRKGSAYHPDADRRSWGATRQFLDEVFSSRQGGTGRQGF